MSLTPVLVVGALYAGDERGLASDVLCARALGMDPLTVCTSLVMAGHGRVTDVTEVPVDAVRAQLEHLRATSVPRGARIGVLADHRTAEAVLDAAVDIDGPVVLDLAISGPSGETVLTTRGIDAVAELLGVASVVTLSRRDAELVTNGEITSLDDAQVAAQRITNRGARAVVIRCGPLPYRFTDAAEDPGEAAGGDGAPVALSLDLCFDGEDFALYEAPLLPEPTPTGAASAFSLAILRGLIDTGSLEAAVQQAKRFATESVRQALPAPEGERRLNPFWEAPRG
jgi:hydroxymethylpyrimidine/phosphomethylpyrimidine kinase